MLWLSAEYVSASAAPASQQAQAAQGEEGERAGLGGDDEEHLVRGERFVTAAVRCQVRGIELAFVHAIADR